METIILTFEDGSKKDVILFKEKEPKARIEESEKITFSLGKIHNISSSITNYPDKDGNYGTNGRGTYAIYDNKVLHATGNRAITVYKNGKNNYIYKIDGEGEKPTNDYSKVAGCEIRGSIINLDFSSSKITPVVDVAKEIISTFKNDWNVNIKTIVEYKDSSSETLQKLDIKDILAKKTPEVKESAKPQEKVQTIQKKNKKSKQKGNR